MATEITNETNPINDDTDGDGVTMATKSPMVLTRTTTIPTSDGIIDGDEVANGTDPNNDDTDGDGINDNDNVTNGTDPINDDSDGDGVNDGDELVDSTDPLNLTPMAMD